MLAMFSMEGRAKLALQTEQNQLCLAPSLVKNDYFIDSDHAHTT